MITRIRKNQNGLAMVEYIIVLAVVAAIAAVLFGSNFPPTGLSGALSNYMDNAINAIKDLINSL